MNLARLLCALFISTVLFANAAVAEIKTVAFSVSGMT